MKKSKIEFYEPWFFIFFGVFHMHRIWGLIDRKGYADFWLNTMQEKGIFYYTLMGILAVLCVLGVITFIMNVRNNYWWRWIYIFGGGYVLFDLFAIETGLTLWHQLLTIMFNIESIYWNIIWSIFIILGCIVFILGITLLKNRNNYKF